jgi:hypothetical protein
MRAGHATTKPFKRPNKTFKPNGAFGTANGYEVLRGEKLKLFLEAMAAMSGKDINVSTKITLLGVFDFRAFLNLAMLLSKIEKARILRQRYIRVGRSVKAEDL